MSFFRIIIPTYNGGQWLPRMVSCIRRQTCQDFHLIIVDDLSTDDTWDVVRSLAPDVAVQVDKPGNAAGARNVGMRYHKEDLYTLWLDDDDVLIDDAGLEKIKRCAESNKYPDIIRLNYRKTKLSTGLPGNHHDRYPVKITPEDICKDVIRGMPWSKAVKTEKCVEFPEALRIDDCFHHIMQADVCETAAVVHDDFYEWRVREGSVSNSPGTVEWLAGWYMEIAMLLLQKKEYLHDYAREAADLRIAWIKRRILGG